jgi:hypothetical protein
MAFERSKMKKQKALHIEKLTRPFLCRLTLLRTFLKQDNTRFPGPPSQT